MPRGKITTKNKSSAKTKTAPSKKQPASLKGKKVSLVASINTSLEEQAWAEREKYIAMWTGVIFFMIIIVAVWLVSFRSNFQAISQQSRGGKEAEWEDIINNFNGAVEEIRGELAGLALAEDKEEILPNEVVPQAEEIDDLRRQLKDIEQKLELEKMLSTINS